MDNCSVSPLNITPARPVPTATQSPRELGQISNLPVISRYIQTSLLPPTYANEFALSVRTLANNDNSEVELHKQAEQQRPANEYACRAFLFPTRLNDGAKRTGLLWVSFQERQEADESTGCAVARDRELHRTLGAYKLHARQ
jgi:hypothetical protein